MHKNFSNYFHTAKDKADDILKALTSSNIKKKINFNYDKLKSVLESYKKMQSSPERKINIINLINVLNEFKAKTLVSDVGTFRHYLNIFANSFENYITSAGSSSFGTGLALGIGALSSAKNNKKDKVVVVTGDGGFNAHIGGLRTLHQMKNKNIIIIVLDNSRNGLIEIYQKKGHQGKTNPQAVEHQEADFVKIAEGYKIKAFNIETLKDFKQKLIKAFNSAETMVIRVPVYYPEEHLERLTKAKRLG